MGAQLSALAADMRSHLPKNVDDLAQKLHIAGHYLVIPGIYIYALIQAGEASWNPLLLLEKILIA